MMTCALYNGMLKVIVKYMVGRERLGRRAFGTRHDQFLEVGGC